MKFKNILITGGCGFVGSSLALKLREALPESKIIALDNLSRKGSEHNVPRLTVKNIAFVQGDVREKTVFDTFTSIDLIIDCAAEPSVMAGKNSSPTYALETNLFGTVQCLELARRTGAAIIFLSTSRIYPVAEQNAIQVLETETRFEIAPEQSLRGISTRGLDETFELGTQRTLYGSTKLASEMLLQEYQLLYGTKFVINRCGVIAGPWQFGKADQGIAPLWMARHLYANQGLSYIGFGGAGKQVRDFLHIEDLWSALQYELEHFDAVAGNTFNLGGGRKCSTSLKELTAICESLTGNTLSVQGDPETRWGDVRLYITDHSKFSKLSGWEPKHSVEDIMKDIYEWLSKRKEELRPLFS